MFILIEESFCSTGELRTIPKSFIGKGKKPTGFYYAKNTRLSESMGTKTTGSNTL